MNIPCNLLPGRRSSARLLGAIPVACLFLFSCAAAQAQDGSDDRAQQVPSSPAPGLAALLEFLDRNGDGVVEPYEGAEAMLLLAGEADLDGDAGLDLDELTGFLVSQDENEREEIEATFEELDRDANGLLTPDEVPDEVLPMVIGADADGSGSVSLEELFASDILGDPLAEFEQELLDFLGSVDEDGDGAFRLEDLPSADRQDFANDFRELDRNNDELVTREELLALLEEETRGATFDVDGDVAYMSGVIGPTTPGRVLELVLEHPGVETIVMIDVPGSMDDDSMIRAAGLVRRMGLGTHMPSDGEVASGGVDFFLAGATRSAEPGARFGVHSWSGFNEEGSDLPRDHPEHMMYLDFYRSMGVSEQFYWFTLEAAPADGIHWMTEQEIGEYSMFTGGVSEAGTTKSKSKEDRSYGLDAVEIPLGGAGIVALPSSVDSSLRKTFDRYTRVTAPNGKPIHILAQAAFTDDQILHVRKVLEHYLTDAPGTPLGADKTKVANAMANRRATMVLFQDMDAMESAFDSSLGELDLSMQDLRANECTPPGSEAYLKHTTRDATFEEVLHLVHDYGIRPALPDYDRKLHLANLAAAKADLWQAWPVDEPENHRNEYFAAAYDNYLDLWTIQPTVYEGEPLFDVELPAGTSHFGGFVPGSRARLKQLDPVGFELLEMFFPPHLTYTAALPVDFRGTFTMAFSEATKYTWKSQHLRSVRLRGLEAANLVGNNHANRLIGNDGDNRLEGKGGQDELDGGPGVDVAVFQGKRSEYSVQTRDGQTTVVDSVEGRDGVDLLTHIELLRFQDKTEQLAPAGD